MNADLHGKLKTARFLVDSSWSLRLFLKGRLMNFQNSPPEELTNISHKGEEHSTSHGAKTAGGPWPCFSFHGFVGFFFRPQSSFKEWSFQTPTFGRRNSTLSSQTLALAMEMPGLCCFKGSNKMSAGMKLWQLGNNVPLSHRIG